MADAQHMGARIRDLRRRRQMTQEALAELCGYTSSYIGQVERGLKNPSVRCLSRISEALGVPVSDIVAGPESKADQAIDRLVDMLREADIGVINQIIDHAGVVLKHHGQSHAAAGERDGKSDCR